MRDIYRRALDALTQRGCLYYRVLFGMQRSAQLMLLARRYPQLLPQASAFALTAVLQTSRRTVVPGSNDMPVLYDHSAYMPSKTRGTFGCEHCHFHKIFIPAWSVVHTFLLDHANISSTLLQGTARKAGLYVLQLICLLHR